MDLMWSFQLKILWIQYALNSSKDPESNIVGTAQKTMDLISSEQLKRPWIQYRRNSSKVIGFNITLTAQKIKDYNIVLTDQYIMDSISS